MGCDGQRAGAESGATQGDRPQRAERQILSYRHLEDSIEVQMRHPIGAGRADQAEDRKPSWLRRTGYQSRRDLGAEARAAAGQRFSDLRIVGRLNQRQGLESRRDNVEGGHPVPVNLTTPYQTFWLMVTAEPNYAVVDPSSHVVLYSAKEGSASDSRALTIRGTLFYFTHYSTYESARADADARAPNQLLQARKAFELASNSAVWSRRTESAHG